MQKILTCFLLIISLLITAGCGQSGVVEYENESAGIRFEYPQEWQIEDMSSRMILSPSEALLNEDPFVENGRLTIVSFPISTVSSTEPQFLLRSVIQPFTQLPDIRQYEPEETYQVDGREAFSISIIGNNELDVETIWHSTIIEGESQLIVAIAEVSQADEALVETAKEIINSIEFLLILE